jgi:hypothetical protein
VQAQVIDVAGVEDPPDPGRSPVRTRWALGVLAAVVALIAVTAAVRRSGDAPDAGPDTVATTSGSTAPATTGQTATTGFGTTTPPGPLTAYPPRTVRYYDPLLPGLASPLTLYGFSPGAQAYPPTVMRLDLATGTEVDTRLPALQSDGPVALLAGPNGMIVRPLDSVPGYRVADGEPAEDLTGLLGGGGPALSGPVPGTFWTPSPFGFETSDGAELTSMRLVDEAGRDLGRGIGVSDPGAAVASDGDGGIVLTLSNGTIEAVTDDPNATPTHIGAGRLIGASPAGFVYLPCDGDRQCPLQMVARNGTPLGAVPIPQPAGKVLAGALSPDGTHLALIVAPAATSTPASASAGPISRFPPVPGLEMIDLRSGQVDPRPWITTNARAGDDAMVWTPDSRWLVMITGVNSLTAMAADLQDSHSTTVNVPYLARLALRPSS